MKSGASFDLKSAKGSLCLIKMSLHFYKQHSTSSFSFVFGLLKLFCHFPTEIGRTTAEQVDLPLSSDLVFTTVLMFYHKSSKDVFRMDKKTFIATLTMFCPLFVCLPPCPCPVMPSPQFFDGQALVSWSDTDITVAVPWYMGLMFRTRQPAGTLMQVNAGPSSTINLMVSYSIKYIVNKSVTIISI